MSSLTIVHTFILGADIDPYQNELNIMATEQQSMKYWYGPDLQQPGGGYLFRFDFDINSDGSYELFLAKSIQADESGVEWDVYSKTTDSTYNLMPITVFMHPDGFRFKKYGEKHVIQLLSRNGNEYELLEYYIDVDGVLKENKTDVTSSMSNYSPANGGNLAQVLSLGEKVQPSIEKILFFVYKDNKDAQWNKYIQDLPPNQQYKDPEDQAFLSTYDDWPSRTPVPTMTTPQQEQIKTPDSVGEEITKKPDQAVSNNGNVADSKERPVVNKEENANSQYNKYILMLIVILIVLVVVTFLRKRKRGS